MNLRDLLKNDDSLIVLYLVGLVAMTALINFTLKKIAKDKQAEKSSSFWSTLHTTLGSSILHVFVLLGLYFGAKGFQPSWLPTQAKEWILSALAILIIAVLMRSAKQITSAKKNLFRIIMWTGVLGSVIWLCDIWGIHLEEESKGYMGIPISMVIACLIYLGGEKMLQPLVSRTKSDLDDLLYEKLITPLCVVIICFGCIHTATSLNSATWIISLIWSVIIISICVGFYGSTTTIITHLKAKKSRAGKHTASLTILQHVSKILAIFIALYFIMLAFGKDPTHWLTFGTLVTAGIAYAAQDTLGSIFASAAIMVDSPYQEGDHLLLENGLRGQVTGIGFRSTRIQTNEDVTVIIPNSTMANSQIFNLSKNESRIDCAACCAYGSDIDTVREILETIGGELKYKSKNKEPLVHFVGMGASSLDFVLRVWLSNPKHYQDVQNQANTLIYKRFTEAGIEIPYSKQDLYLYPMGSLKSEPDQ